MPAYISSSPPTISSRSDQLVAEVRMESFQLQTAERRVRLRSARDVDDERLPPVRRYEHPGRLIALERAEQPVEVAELDEAADFLVQRDLRLARSPSLRR